jgi:hypothetical protein
MPATSADRERHRAHATRRRLMFPYGYIQRVLRCHQCGRKGFARDIPRWHTETRHTCPGPWALAGFTEGPQ